MTEEKFWWFKGFGLIIQSCIFLAELEETDERTVDLLIERGRIDLRDTPMTQGWRYQFSELEQYLALPGAAKYLVQGKNRVVVDLDQSMPEHLAGYTILGTVMATVLHVRGALVLHGSALMVDGRAVLFLGDKGAGKSTTAGAMVSAGHSLVTDDVIAVERGPQGVPVAVPAYPMIKLSDEALSVYGTACFDIIPTEHVGLTKQRAMLRRALPAKPVPIASVYMLSRGGPDEAAAVTPLSAGEALQLLFANSYMTRFGVDPFARLGAMGDHMGQCAALVKHAKVSRLQVPGDISRLADVVELVVRDSAEAAAHI